MFRWLKQWRTGLNDGGGRSVALVPDVEKLEELTRILREAREAVSLAVETRPPDNIASLSQRRP